MSLLDIENLTHAFGDVLLFRDAALSLNKGEHIGIVGQNGVGKSTLIKLCTEQIAPDAGRIAWQPGISVGYLDQYAQLEQDLTMRDFLKSAFSSLYAIEEKMNLLYEQAGKGELTALKQAALYQERLEANDFYLIDTRIEQVAGGLGLLPLGLDCCIGQMSGGQRAKVILAKLLLEKPAVLLLDEPTNFLDKEHVAWLGDYLANLENAFLVVSHDYDFLEKISNRICDIDNQKISKYYGAYSEFIKKKALLRKDYIRQYAASQREIKKTEEFIRRNIAGRKSRMARGRQKKLDRMDRLEELNQREIKPSFHFPELPVTKDTHLEAFRLSVGYYYPVLLDLTFSISGGQKIVITGFNGIGKSTLLKTLTGQLPALGGSFFLNPQTTVGYYEQDLLWEDEELTPFQILSDAFPSFTAKEIRRELSRCAILSRHVMQPIKTLSGGEQAKVKMCLLTVKPCNLLILDEPTSHLDIQAKESLSAALSAFSGTVILVSHEESFYRDWIQKTIDVEKLMHCSS